MDSKKIKATLLEAREAIKQKDFVTAKRICQEILNSDEKNYNALVFYGYAAQEMQEHEKAVAAFKKAIGISPSQLLAWQGLRAFYEKETPLVHKQELVDVYFNFLNFYKEDNKKQVDILYHLGLTFYKELNDPSKAVDHFCEALEITGNELSSDNAKLWSTLFVILSSKSPLSAKEFELLGCSFDKVCEGKSATIQEFETCNFTSLENYFEKLLKEEQCYARIIEEARKTLRFYPENEFLVSVQIHAFFKCLIERTPLAPDDLDDMVGYLSEDNPNKAFYVFLIRGAKFFIAGNWIEARDSLLNGMQLKTLNWWEVRLLLCWTLEKFYDGIGVERFAVEGLKYVDGASKESRQKNVTCLFKLSLGKGLLFQGNSFSLEKALSVLAEAAEDIALKSQALYFQGVIYLKLSKLEQVEKILKELEISNTSHPQQLAIVGQLHAARGDFEAAKQSLVAAEEISPDNDDWILQLGNAFTELLNHSAAHKCYLKAAKINPCNAMAFLKLGHYYKNVAKDPKKSLECYKFAFQLNKHDEIIGISLSDSYQQLNDSDANVALLRTITNNSAAGSPKWASLRLGLLLIRRNEINDAIRAFQCALRVDPEDSECWQCLGETYLMRGSHANALKAFKRALELNPNLLYCIYQSANIKLSLGFFKEAATYFNEISQLVPNYIPAMKGLGESYLAQAKTYLKHSNSVKALSLCEATLFLLSRALAEQTYFMCIWKLLGDACTLPGLMSGAIVKIQVPSILLNDPSLTSEIVTLDKLQALKLGERCYLAAIRQSPHNASLWHDFGINAYYQALTHAESSEKFKSINYSLAAMKKAVSIRESSFYWNALGVIASVPELKKYDLAQHAFIQAVLADANNYTAWSNLSVLYLVNGNDKLANQTFAISQSIEPSYINSWLGQAIIAENIKHSDAMDLFRHCTYIGTHVEGYIGYASWVCSTLLNTVVHDSWEFNSGKMDAIAQASDSLSHYTDIIRDNLCAYNMLGLLLERQDQLRSAEAAFQNAVKLINVSSETKIADAVRCNFARILRKMGKVQLSIDEALCVKEVDFYNQYGLAASHREMNLLQESTAAYVLAMQQASTEEQKSNLFVSMASMSYILCGSEEAKSLLFQSFQMKPACVQGLIALSALGLILGDAALLAAAVEELKPWDQDEKYKLDVTHLRACQAVLEGDVSAARRIYCKAIHLWPTDWPLWPHLARHLLHHSSDLKMATYCSSAAAKLCVPPALHVLKLLSLCYSFLQMDEKGLKMAENLLHSYPGEAKYHNILARIF